MAGKPPKCMPCPTNCICQGGETFSWNRGFYPVLSDFEDVTNSSTTPVRTVLQAIPCAGTNTTSNCNPHSNCMAGMDGVLLPCMLCSEGSSERLCSRCQCR